MATWNGIRDNVSHDNPRCSDGSSIPKRQTQAGSGGKPLCPNCAKLNGADRFNAAKGAGVIIGLPSERVKSIQRNLAHPARGRGRRG